MNDQQQPQIAQPLVPDVQIPLPPPVIQPDRDLMRVRLAKNKQEKTKLLKSRKKQQQRICGLERKLAFTDGEIELINTSITQLNNALAAAGSEEED